ncbi:MAG: ABC transporter substrate-binding protein [Chloroflexota bacterium]|jgi:peptide/nickel transport system substrate-binding protein|nr:ABC transporter substrate-binding protein [Chloroflexota bacterium]
MSRSRRWSPRLAVLAASAAIVFAACGGSTATTTPSTAPESSAPTTAPESMAPYEAMVYPASGEAPCGQTDAPDANHSAYTGNFKKISATDEKTVVFELCNPDVAFLSKIAFTSFAINDTAWLESKIDPAGTTNQAIVNEVNGTGPYKLEAWNRGSDVTMARNDAYWGNQAKTEKLIFRWSTEAAQRLVELQSGTVDGIDNVGPTDFPTVEGDAALALKPRAGLNIFYVGMNNTYAPFDNDMVRQAIAMGIDRQRLVDNFYPPGSEVATHFTPCAIPNGCAGDAWYEFDAAAAKQMLADAGFPDGFTTKIQYRDVVRSYLPDPNVVAQDIQAQLKANLNITADIEVQESGTFLDNADAGKLEGIHLLGWGADYPDVTNFLDFHFGSGSSLQFGDKWDDITSALAAGGAGTDDAAREPSYVTANNAIKTHVPMIPIAHGGSAVAYRADVTDAHSSPLGNEYFAVMTPGDRSQFVWMQNAEPPGLYCADESDGEALRVCEQMTESLYSYEVAGTAAEPALAEKCEPNTELTVWTCTLRSGVTFHDGAALDANDVVLTYAVQWDADHPLHKGRDGSFTYFPGLFSGFLNPPPPAPEG